MESEDAKQLSYEDFFKSAIITLRDISKSRGIHSVFSGFNEAFRKYYDEDPIRVTQMLAKRGKIAIRPVKRGVMIYLPEEGPGLNQNLAEEALSKILGKSKKADQAIIQQVIALVAPGGTKRFPEDFLQRPPDQSEFESIEVAGTPLQLATGSNTLIVSPKKHFRYDAKNPAEAKYVLYAHKIGETVIQIPKSNQAIFRAVVSYEKYCQEIGEHLFGEFLSRTNDEGVAEDLTAEAISELGLPILNKDQ